MLTVVVDRKTMSRMKYEVKEARYINLEAGNGSPEKDMHCVVAPLETRLVTSDLRAFGIPQVPSAFHANTTSPSPALTREMKLQLM